GAAAAVAPRLVYTGVHPSSGRAVNQEEVSRYPASLPLLEEVDVGAWRRLMESLASAAPPAIPQIAAGIEVALLPGDPPEASVTLANRSEDDLHSRETDAGLFDARLEVQLLDRGGSPLAPEPYLLELPVHGYLYDRRQFVAGRNCNGAWD